MPYKLEDIQKKVNSNMKAEDSSLYTKKETSISDFPILKPKKTQLKKKKQESKDNFDVIFKKTSMIIGLILSTILLTSILIKLIFLMFS